MSLDTWLCAVLMAASADSTSFGGSIPVISDASKITPYRAGPNVLGAYLRNVRLALYDKAQQIYMEAGK